MTPPLNLVTGGALKGALGDSLFGAQTADIGPLGHIRVDRWLGSGGMGEVYLGIDERLHRKVALKTLSHLGNLSADRRRRFEREARVLASLDHPNICRLYDLLETERGDVLVLEYVEGESLRQRCGEMAPAEALKLLHTLAQVLVTTHASQVVHRDLKPDNLMVTSDGALKVLDFGIASLGDDALIAPETTLPSNPALTTSLTATGELVGTLAYMAPEQLSGRAVTPAADCYAYGLVMVELLTGVRVRDANLDITALRAQVRDTASALPPLGDPQLDALARALLRHDPERRPSAEEIVNTIDQVLRAPERRRARRRRNLAASALALAIVGAGSAGTLLAARQEDQARRAPICLDVEGPIAEVWSQGQAEQLNDLLLATGRPFAPATATRVRERFNVYAADWVEMRQQACLEHATGLQSDTLYDRRVACLDERLNALRGAVDVLSEAGAELVEEAVTIANRLPPLEPCADTSALMDKDPPPEDPALRAALEEEGPRRARLATEMNARRYPEALALADGLLERARALDYPPLIAEALNRKLRVLFLLREFKRAEGIGDETWELALASRDGSLALTTAMLLTELKMHRLELEEAEFWAQTARGLLARGGFSPLLEASYNMKIGRLRFEQGRLDEAAAEFEKAIKIHEPLAGTPEYDLLIPLSNLAMVRMMQGDFDSAEALSRRAGALVIEQFGELHPERMPPLSNLAGIAMLRGRYDESRALNEEILAIAEPLRGPESLVVVMTQTNTADALVKQGRLDEAEPIYQRGAELMLRQFGPNSPEYIYQLLGLANVMLGRERYDEALPLAEQALAGFAPGKTSPDRSGAALFAVAKALWGTGRDRRRALKLADEAASALRGFGDGVKIELEEVDAWIERHGRP